MLVHGLGLDRVPLEAVAARLKQRGLVGESLREQLGGDSDAPLVLRLAERLAEGMCLERRQVSYGDGCVIADRAFFYVGGPLRFVRRDGVEAQIAPSYGRSVLERRIRANGEAHTRVYVRDGPVCIASSRERDGPVEEASLHAFSGTCRSYELLRIATDTNLGEGALIRADTSARQRPLEQVAVAVGRVYGKPVEYEDRQVPTPFGASEELATFKNGLAAADVGNGFVYVFPLSSGAAHLLTKRRVWEIREDA